MPCRVPKCAGCPFPSIHTVGPSGPLDSPFVIVGESPGREENREGRPFVGQSGTVIREALSRLPHPEPYWTNSFKCMPITGKNKKKDEEIVHLAVQACNSGLEAELASRPNKPKIILALGNGALWATTGNHGLKISKARGRLYPSKYAEVGVIAALHPAALLRGFGSWRQFTRDVILAMHLVNGGEYVQPGSSNYTVIDNPLDLVNLSTRFKQASVIAADIETSDLSWLKGTMISAGFTDNGKDVFLFPREFMRQYSLNPLFHNSAHYVWHNGKFDLHFMHAEGHDAARLDDDTMLESYALDERRGVHDLEQVAKDWLNSPDWKAELDKHKKKKESYEVIPKPILYRYQAYDIANTFHLHNILRPLISAQPLAELLYTKTLIPASHCIKEIEENGIPIDPEKAVENHYAYQDEINKWDQELNTISIDLRGRGVNPNSPIQLVELLYDKFKGDPPVQVGFGIKTKIRSTEDDVLKELHPTEAKAAAAVNALRKYRKPKKADSTYALPYIPELAELDENGNEVIRVNEDCVIQPDGKVHSTYLIHGTPTGRLASRDPNLQNIPRGPDIRNQFVALPGRKFIEVDLNQAELRSLACLSQDPYLCHIYETEGMSLHEVQRSASYGDPKDWSALDIERYLSMFNLTHETRYNKGKDRIVEEQKMRAKAVNFGIVYGRTAPSLAEEFHAPVSEAERWIQAWFGRFPQARLFIEVCRQAPRRGKDLVTPFGRRKRHGIVAPQILTSLENEAANMPHQSIASDINLHVAISLRTRLREEYDTRIINLVHDSIILDAPDDPDTQRQVITTVTTRATEVPKEWGLNRIPFKADAKIGNRWGELSEDAVKQLFAQPQPISPPTINLPS